MKLHHLNRFVAVAASSAVLLGGAIATAPTASAESLPKACTTIEVPEQRKVTKSIVHLRSGPGTKYTSKGLLQKGTKFDEWCNKRKSWSYGKVLSGANKGKKGWVAYRYLKR
ncbi:SH3 domain-containing protein [Streptomyces bluensis]|uniref:SH3 domain-containing protein n=1 Tax=Streptomyces bluensis TaxID=33897 RepID=UPI0033179BBC